ncbi:MAG: anthranilate phosphoribosyltransferase [Phycisphaerales bacterium]|nr:anthranilate phosphoribosyltransferase [Phycisphaerales bacterium]
MKTTEPLLCAIEHLQEGKTLSADEIAGAFRVIMNGGATDGLIGCFLGILATRTPTGQELFGASTVMRECAERIDLPNRRDLLDTCGTGGAPKTFNVSTAASIVSAACGVRVAKHGNRSRTGRGSAEILEKLGINIDASINQQINCLRDAGICFCFAPKHHKAVANVMPVRKELPFPTIFNLLGPLTNPCSAGRQLLGVWDDQYVTPVAESLLAHGTVKSAVVHSNDGLDELSISAPTRVIYVIEGRLIEETIDPRQVGLKMWNIDEVTADSLDSATDMIYDCLVEKKPGAPRDMVLLSSAVGLFLADLVNSVSDGVIMASKSIDSGATKRLIEKWGKISNTE